MLKAGMIIGERYEILGKIGTGGMADVYKAKDHKLNRFIAIKVLKQEFREDTNFIRKFRAEAQSAAGLTHPNIVNVYDVGDDQGIHYIVMELIEGITLKEYISKKGKLSIKEATSIAIQVSMGLEAAHSHGIVHRDVKPQNIIISTDGKVKVTDFGIARAASANTISSNAMGSVHYSSPEQVRGGYSDEKSDIYSLGITLYEMVTGHVPFDGDTTVAIAIKHLQEEMVPPSEYTQDLPHSLEQIIFKCTQKSVDRRYSNMTDVIADLKHSLIDPQGDFVQLVPLNTQAKTVIISDDELGEIKQNKNAMAKQEMYQERSGGHARKLEEEEYDDSYDDGYDDYDDDYRGRRGKQGISRSLEKAVTIGGIIVGVLIIIVLAVGIAKASGLLKFGNSAQDSSKTEETQDSTSASMVEVPDLVGLTEDQAKEKISSMKVGIRYTGEEESDLEEGLISSQEIAPGTQVAEYSTINYKLSKGKETVTVPDVIDRTQEDAEQILKDMGFEVSITKQYSDTVLEGNVISSSPTAGTSVSKGAAISLVVSDNDAVSGELKVVPDVIGITEEEAKSRLSDFAVTVETGKSNYVNEGEVFYQSLDAGSEVAEGTAIIIQVNRSVQETPVPTEPAQEPDGEVTQAPEAEGTGTWKCTQRLDTPTGYSGGMIRLELVQTVDGSPVATTVVDGKQLEFPYQLNITGAEGVSQGTLYLSELVGDNYVELGHYPITFEKVE